MACYASYSFKCSNAALQTGPCLYSLGGLAADSLLRDFLWFFRFLTWSLTQLPQLRASATPLSLFFSLFLYRICSWVVWPLSYVMILNSDVIFSRNSSIAGMQNHRNVWLLQYSFLPPWRCMPLRVALKAGTEGEQAVSCLSLGQPRH